MATQEMHDAATIHLLKETWREGVDEIQCELFGRKSRGNVSRNLQQVTCRECLTLAADRLGDLYDGPEPWNC